MTGAARTCVGLLLVASAAAAETIPFQEYAREDPAKTVTAEKCGECHTSELEVWRQTPHATGFKTLHRKEQAQAIASKLGFRLIKRQSFCFRCHYTPVIEDDALRMVSGVSCESCHGAGLDYVEVHNDYGEGNDFRTEPEEHRRRRIERSRAAGMLRPSDLYPVAARCFACHTVPNERLVNVGGHGAGSANFEFVAWSQEELRHNFLDASRAGGQPVNARRSPERKREMYVTGRAADLEYSLRAMAEATEDGVFAKAMARRVRSATAELRAVERAAGIEEVGRMLAVVRGVQVAPDNRAALLAAADEISRQIRGFLQRADGSQWAVLDPLLEGLALPAPAEEEEGLEAVVAELPAPSGPEGAPAGEAGAAGVAPATGGSSPAAAATPRGAAQPAVTGTFRRRLRTPSEHRTLGPGACSSCHGPQNEWWFSDPHYRSADPFFDGNPKNLRIARLYGISAGKVTRGTELCMDCHGTVVSGKEAREVLDGVSCESCHGAAADWLEPHKQGEGRSRPGFAQALALGKRDPRDAERRAQMCVACHLITDRRLLSSGHPSGQSFDYARGMQVVRHWRETTLAPGATASAFAGAVAARGPVPEVVVASLPEPAAVSAGPILVDGASEPPSSAPAAVTAGPTGRAAAGALETAPAAAPERAARFAASASPAPREVSLPEFPEIEEGMPVEEVLLLLRERLRLLYGLLEPPPKEEDR